MTALPTPWRKPSGTRDHGAELRLCGDGHVEIRHSLDAFDEHGTEIWFAALSRAEFGEFLAAAKAGEFDDLAEPAS